MLSSNGSLDLWIVFVREYTGDWGRSLSKWVNLLANLSSSLSVFLGVDGSDRWNLEGFLLSFLPGDGGLELWLVGVGRVEHSIDVGLAIWVLTLLDESTMWLMVMVVLLEALDLNSTGLEVSEVNLFHGEIIVDCLDGANESSNS